MNKKHRAQAYLDAYMSKTAGEVVEGLPEKAEGAGKNIVGALAEFVKQNPEAASAIVGSILGGGTGLAVGGKHRAASTAVGAAVGGAAGGLAGNLLQDALRSLAEKAQASTK